MLSSEDLERLIAVKRREIEQEKTVLGLAPHDVEDQKGCQTEKKVAFRPRAFSESNVSQDPTHEEEITPDLERYIRRYIGLPGMLKAGEYSPNNPLTREERVGGDALRALGEYERRRHTLRKIRQRQYKEYLDQQAKKKQEAKEQAEREQREREEKERLREEKERERLELREKSPERRRLSVNVLTNDNYVTKTDTAVQVDHTSTPLSVAVQTDGRDLILSRNITQAERELSPRNVGEFCTGRRRSYGDYDDRNRVTSIFDEDIVKMRNLQAEKEALERRQYYQQELRNQILEQQRIREERKSREKMLEQAEMRRLEEQLRSLKMAQERETQTQTHRHAAMTDNALEYEKKRTTLQKEIDYEKHLLKIHRHTRSESPKLHYYSKPYSSNIPENSLFSPNYDVESYLRRNLNPYKDLSNDYKIERKTENQRINRNICVDNELIHENPQKNNINYEKDTFRNTFVEKDIENPEKTAINDELDALPIPVLRNSPKLTPNVDNDTDLSEKMQIVDNKYKIPVIQKNILKCLNEKGKNVSILTQLGSIRRQLQLEQMKLDKLTEK